MYKVYNWRIYLLGVIKLRKTKYTNEELTQIVESSSDCKFIDTYMKKLSRGTLRMLVLKCGCGKEFEVGWSRFNRKDGIPQKQCQDCGKEIRVDYHRKTDADYQKEKIEKGILIKNIEPYILGHTPIRHICPNCLSDDWLVTPHNILTGASSKCKMCTGGHNKLDDEWYQSEKQRLGINIKNVQEYNGVQTPIWHICPECDGGWLVRPAGILSGNSKTCTPCSYKIRAQEATYTEEDVRRILSELSLEWVSGKYEHKDSVLSLRCSCGEIFEKRYSDARSGWNRCPKCALSISTGEQHIKDYLDALSTQYIHQQKFDDLRGKRNMPLSYDFGIYEKEKLVALVEYDGGHHFKPIYSFYKTKEQAEKEFEAQLLRDRRKNDYAKSIRVPLIRLSGHDYKNLDANLGEKLKEILQYTNTEVSENITRHRNA